jgi:hypothetical protein
LTGHRRGENSNGKKKIFNAILLVSKSFVQFKRNATGRYAESSSDITACKGVCHDKVRYFFSFVDLALTQRNATKKQLPGKQSDVLPFWLTRNSRLKQGD